jgi:predicted O-linked N-acetylglucosamine transferase (SPINDLY family)
VEYFVGQSEGPAQVGVAALDDGSGRSALLAGNVDEALLRLTTQINDEPSSFTLLYDLYAACLAAGDDASARDALNTAASLHAIEIMRESNVDLSRFSTDSDYAFQICSAYYQLEHPGVASVAAGRAIHLGLMDEQVLKTYGLSLQHQGRVEEATEIYRAGADGLASASMHQFLMYALFFVPDGVERNSQEAMRWAEQFARVVASVPQIPKPLAGRRLKIGYVAPNFSTLQLAQFLVPILEAHDRTRVEITLYTTSMAAEAGLTADRVVEIGRLSDDQAKAAIMRDGIDVLIDTWGHTAGNRMGIFARRAAPVQVSWINYVQTTGLRTMDYALHADSMEVEGTNKLFTEKIWYLGDLTIPYRPKCRAQTPSPAPALVNGYVTFGCFNHPAKVSEVSVFHWAEILKAVPTAKLLLKYRYYRDPLVRAQFCARFAAVGIDQSRLLFEAHSLGDDYLAAFGRVDLMLDPSPCPGGTTTCDAVANSVPVVTLAGDNFYSRIGVQVVAGAGIPEMVAESWDQYIQIAVGLAENVEVLAATRARLGSGFETSVLRDEVNFTRHLEDVFFEMTALAMTRARSKGLVHGKINKRKMS